jgi:hypothetical protein
MIVKTHSFKQTICRAIGYSRCTCGMMLETLALLIPRSDEHPWVMLVTIEAIVWLEQASLEHKPVNQVLTEGMTEVPELETRMLRSPAVFIHWASGEVATEAMLDWHGVETVAALKWGK